MKLKIKLKISPIEVKDKVKDIIAMKSNISPIAI